MPGYVVIVLVSFLAAVTAGIGWAGAQALRAWRQVRPSARRTLSAVRHLADQAEALGARAGTLGGGGAELASAVAGLSRSLHRLRLALEAAGEVELLLGWARWLPRRR